MLSGSVLGLKGGRDHLVRYPCLHALSVMMVGLQGELVLLSDKLTDGSFMTQHFLTQALKGCQFHYICCTYMNSPTPLLSLLFQTVNTPSWSPSHSLSSITAPSPLSLASTSTRKGKKEASCLWMASLHCSHAPSPPPLLPRPLPPLPLGGRSRHLGRGSCWNWTGDACLMQLDVCI